MNDQTIRVTLRHLPRQPADTDPSDTDQDIPADVLGPGVADPLPPPLPSDVPAETPLGVLIGITLLTGVAAGIGAMMLALLLHLVQHLAYGYSLNAVVSKESFLQGVVAASALRRVAVLLGCGFAAGCGWYAVYRFGKPLVSIKRAVEPDSPSMPLVATTGHALLQIVTVALGSPLGREVAPREVGAMLAGWFSRRAGLSTNETRVMVACGAGAGLAAVYNVPLAGAFFTLEVLLQTTRLSAVIPAIATSCIATAVAWAGLGDEAQYHIPAYEISAGIVSWSILVGPIMGFAAYKYTKIAAWARARAPRDTRLMPWCIGVFTAIGALAIWFPALLGNGKGPMQLSLGGDLTIGLVMVLLVLKLAATTASLRAGAEGGLLTPGLTIGALLSIILGEMWNLAGFGVPAGAYAIVGATAFLAVSMRMPVTAIALAFEFTHVGQDFLIPIMAATAGSMAMREWMVMREDATVRLRRGLPSLWGGIARQPMSGKTQIGRDGSTSGTMRKCDSRAGAGRFGAWRWSAVNFLGKG
jgi:H+/Cl- antiporter ClcA